MELIETAIHECLSHEQLIPESLENFSFKRPYDASRFQSEQTKIDLTASKTSSDGLFQRIKLKIQKKIKYIQMKRKVLRIKIKIISKQFPLNQHQVQFQLKEKHLHLNEELDMKLQKVNFI